VREPDGDSTRFVLDLDGEGRLLGIEAFDARSSLPDVGGVRQRRWDLGDEDVRA
jgi:hypothetical protein